MYCKNCRKNNIVKNGQVRGQQRYRCKDCGYNFIEGDRRSKRETAIKRAFAVILYSLGKASYRFIAKLFDVCPASVQRWLEKESAMLADPQISESVREIEFDEMWHFVGAKKTKDGSSKRWIALQAKPSRGLSAVVMLRRSDGSMTKSNT